MTRVNNKKVANVAELIGTLIINGYAVSYDDQSEGDAVYVNNVKFIDCCDFSVKTVSEVIDIANECVSLSKRSNIVESQTVSFKDALNLLTKKYGADQQSINCESMSNEDYAIYIELDDCIEQLKQLMYKLMPAQDSAGEGMTGEYGE